MLEMDLFITMIICSICIVSYFYFWKILIIDHIQVHFVMENPQGGEGGANYFWIWKHTSVQTNEYFIKYSWLLVSVSTILFISGYSSKSEHLKSIFTPSSIAYSVF